MPAACSIAKPILIVSGMMNRAFWLFGCMIFFALPVWAESPRVNLLRSAQWLVVDGSGNEVLHYGRYKSHERVDVDAFNAALKRGVDRQRYAGIDALADTDGRVRLSLRGLDESNQPIGGAKEIPTTLEVTVEAVGDRVTHFMPEDVFVRVQSANVGAFVPVDLSEMSEPMRRLMPSLEAVQPGKPLVIRLPFPRNAFVSTGDAATAEVDVVLASTTVQLAPNVKEVMELVVHSVTPWKGVICSDSITVTIPKQWHQRWPTVRQPQRELLEQ